MQRINLILLLITSICSLSCNNDDSLNGDVQTSATAHLYAATHNGVVKRYDINNGDVTTYNTASSDVEGIYFSSEEDLLTLVSRSGSRIESYPDISQFQSGATVNIETDFIGNPDLESPRDLAVNGNFYVVSDDTDLDGDDETSESRLFIYFKTSLGFSLRNVVTTKFKLWGIEFVENDLYVAVDETNKIALYRNFLTTHTLNRIITADKIVGFQGLLRAHGLDYEDGTMVISDIGDIESNSDGAIHVVDDFVSKFSEASNAGFVQTDAQHRIAGGNTNLGNPVDLLYDADYNVIFVAEAANSGGRVLAFNNAKEAEGNLAPDLRYNLPGISSIYFHTR